MKTTVIFDNLGPYHLARLRAAAQVCDVTAVEIAASSAEYAWQREAEARGRKSEVGSQAGVSNFTLVTLLEAGTSRETLHRELGQKLVAALTAARPDVVFIPGWSSRAAFAALHWCVQNKVPVVAMSESTEWDEKRSPLKEWVKRQIVGMCSAGLVGGTPHRDYMIKLGMPAEQIFPGYDAVDNDYFAQAANKIRSMIPDICPAPHQSQTQADLTSGPGSLQAPSSKLQAHPFFLASARFIEKKNLPRLIEAYALYRQLAQTSDPRPPTFPSSDPGLPTSDLRPPSSVLRPPSSDPGLPTSVFRPPTFDPWPLVLLGDGALRAALSSQLQALGLVDSVQMPGFVQYPELPEYYARAGVFIHASTTEQWGLVVNEAMASGLPVLVSNRCGCASDLVQSGVNGFTFDPYNVEELAQLMLRVGSMEPGARSRMGHASRQIIADWGTDRFASGLKAAAETARAIGPRSGSFAQRLLLKVVLYK